MRIALTAVVLLLATGIPVQANAASIKQAQVVGDNEIAAYIGTGGLLLSSSFTGTSTKRTEIANCSGCTWAYSIYCMYDAEGLCQHALIGCPVGEVKYRVWFGRTAQTAVVVGSTCWGSGHPPTRRDIENRIDDLVINYIPSLQVNSTPSGGTLTNLPLIAWTNQPTKYSPPIFQLAGREVAITAVPSWRWVWGDGAVEWSARPGCRYPCADISHLYRAAGTYTLSVTAVWQATYAVEGIGTFSAAGDVLTQSKQVQIQVQSVATTLVKHR